MEHNYVILPSNSSMTFHPNNTIANFNVQLPKPLKFKFPVEVGLVEIIYPYIHSIVTKNEAFLEIYREPYKSSKNANPPEEYDTFQETTILPSGSYKKISEITVLLEKPLKKYGIWLEHTEHNNRFRFKGIKKAHIKMSRVLARLLGFGDGSQEIVTIDKNTSAPYAPDLCSGQHTMFIYSSIVAGQYLGDQFAPLLRVVCPDSSKFGTAMISEKYIKPYYLKVCKSYIDAIDISIQTETGKPYPFQTGSPIILKLHFREIV